MCGWKTIADRVSIPGKPQRGLRDVEWRVMAEWLRAPYSLVVISRVRVRILVVARVSLSKTLTTIAPSFGWDVKP